MSAFYDMQGRSIDGEYEGVTVLGIPCGQVGHQEPGDNSSTQQFCTQRFDLRFPPVEKNNVNGPLARQQHRHGRQCLQNGTLLLITSTRDVVRSKPAAARA
ncbi:hypothetical protein ACJU26_03415 [Acidithiobacillus sp. M4-SHS-6]|uniref:hypothetical protein n=1 Tax=Acidithiobacillus sp. M4-SHS-6 TaxID=3383024 RepID=UPI0039BE35F4